MRFVVHRYQSIPSTNDEAIRLAQEAAPDGAVVVAAEQTAGRGRRGRTWSSPAGEGLYLSVVLRPDKPLDQLWQLGFVASVAVAEAIADVFGLPARIKWPNDVLIKGRKVCGILIEIPKAAACQTAVVVGLGINVRNTVFPVDLSDKATSLLLELGSDREVDVQSVEGAVLAALHRRYDQYVSEGFGPILQAWKSLDCTVGRKVIAVGAENEVEGTAVATTAEGDLVVQLADGGCVLVTEGDVWLLDTDTP